MAEGCWGVEVGAAMQGWEGALEAEAMVESDAMTVLEAELQMGPARQGEGGRGERSGVSTLVSPPLPEGP